MDPALHLLIGEGAPDDEVAVVVRLHQGASPPRGLRLVARFGPVATGRAARGDLARIHDDPAMASTKAPREYTTELEEIHDQPGIDEGDPGPVDSDIRRPEGLAETGRDTVIAVIDWGCDFAHPDFRNADGSTRLIALWDQRAPGASARYGYGRIHDRAAINRALKESDPYAALDYHTSDVPWHGTHVLGIAAGSGRAGGPSGIAPEADIIFCHLGTGDSDLGNSIHLLEAIHFAARRAGDKPLAINLSVGRQCGPHDASLLLERAIDWLISHRHGTAVAQSTGNYYARRCHMAGRLHETKIAQLPFEIGERSKNPVLVEIWYPGSDEFTAAVSGPGGAHATAARGDKAPVLLDDGRDVGTLYHRAFDPNNGDHLINLILRADAPSGLWQLAVSGLDVVDGRWHSWIERDTAGKAYQAQFIAAAAKPSSTTGSICNALRTIAVGAYDAHDPDNKLGVFSSVGPTRDGRVKPLLVAPGVRELSCRSRSVATIPATYVRMTGTSMAAPYVTGTLALMMQAAGRQPIAVLRRTLFANLAAAAGEGPRWGYGRLAIVPAVTAARELKSSCKPDGNSNPPRIESAEAMKYDELILESNVQNDEPLNMLRRALDPDDPVFTVVGWPGRRLRQTLETGDLVMRPDGTRLALIADPVLLGRQDAATAGFVTEGPWPGRYARMTGPDGNPSRIARRIAGPDGMVNGETVIIRPNTEPSETPDPSVTQPRLRRGALGPAVSTLQTRLNRIHAHRIANGESGLERCPLDVDGKFGTATSRAVVSFQRLAFPRLPNEWDGVVGSNTWAQIDVFDVVVPPQPQAAATVEFVLDDDDDRRVDGNAPVATALMYGLWDRGYDAAGDIRNGVNEADNFVGSDRRRFYLRVHDVGVTANNVSVPWRTVTSSGSNDDAPASRAVTLVETTAGSKIFVSKALMLVSDDTDSAHATHSGLSSGPDAGIRQRGQSNHRLRRAALDGSVVADYAPVGGGQPVSVTLPVFERKPDARRRIDVRVINYGTHATAAQIAAQFAVANARWAQTGLRIVAAATVDRPIPAAAQDGAGRYAGAADNDAEVAALADLIPVNPDNTLTVVFARKPTSGPGASNAYTTLFERTRSALGRRFFIFINPNVDIKNVTLAHEFHHVLFNRPDLLLDETDIDLRRFFSFNTNPPDSYSLPLPDVRVERRIQTLHSANPDSDPQNDNIINWIKRQRTTRFPFPAALAAPDSSTGNTLVGRF